MKSKSTLSSLLGNSDEDSTDGPEKVITDYQGSANAEPGFLEREWPSLLGIAVAIVLLFIVIATFTNSAGTLTDREKLWLTISSSLLSVVASILGTQVRNRQLADRRIKEVGTEIARLTVGLYNSLNNLHEWILGKHVEVTQDETTPNHGIHYLEHINLSLFESRDQCNNVLNALKGVIANTFESQEKVLARMDDVEFQSEQKRRDLLSRLSEAPKEGQPSLKAEIEAALANLEREKARRIDALRSIAPLPVPRPPAIRTESATVECPDCSTPSDQRILKKPGQTKTVVCTACGNRYNCHVMGDLSIRVRNFSNEPKVLHPILRAMKEKHRYIPGDRVDQVAQFYSDQRHLISDIADNTFNINHAIGNGKDLMVACEITRKHAAIFIRAVRQGIHAKQASSKDKFSIDRESLIDAYLSGQRVLATNLGQSKGIYFDDKELTDLLIH